MVRRPARDDRVLSHASVYVVPAVITGWALLVVWGSEDALAKALVALAVAAVLTRPWPLIGLVAAFAGLLVGVGLTPPVAEDAQLAFLVLACYRLGRYAPVRRQPWAAAGVLMLLSLNVVQPGEDVKTADVVFPILLTAGPWLLGLSVQLAQRREAAAVSLVGELDEAHAEELRRATAEERLRIAQEFHDVVAHDISGLSLQAQVARRRAEAGHRVDADVLKEIESTAQRAMTDLRQLLGFLRPDGTRPALAPAESLDEVPALLGRARQLGQQVELRVTGTPRHLPPALSAAAYRILQEALTNARRHGSPGPTLVEMGWQAGSLNMTVCNPASPTAGSLEGHGVTGIRERTRLFGGHADIGATAAGWTVTVQLPTPVQSTPTATS